MRGVIKSKWKRNVVSRDTNAMTEFLFHTDLQLPVKFAK